MHLCDTLIWYEASDAHSRAYGSGLYGANDALMAHLASELEAI
jgi:hypothetical protein